jgi:hypothetical protein
MVELRADEDDDAFAFGELIAFGFDPRNDLALGHGGVESRHEDLPDLQSNRRGCLESRSELESHRGGRRCERDAGRTTVGVWRADLSLSPTAGGGGVRETRDGRRGETVRERRGTADGGRRCYA